MFQRIYDKIYAKLMADMVPNMMAKGMDTEKDVVDSMDGSRVNPTMMPQDGAGNNEEIEVRSPNIKKTGAVLPILGELDNINVPMDCELLRPSETEHQAIAAGKVHPSENGVIHGIPLRENHLKVYVRKVYESYKLFPHPVPTEEAYNL